MHLSRKTSAVAIGALVCALAFSVYVLATSTLYDENEAALALVNELKEILIETEEFAFYSSPNNCEAELKAAEKFDPDLVENFVTQNKKKPIYLSYLEGEVNLLSWDDNLHLYETNGLSKKFRPSEKRLIGLSRAGFSPDKRQALFCVDAYGEIFIYLKKNGEDEWVLQEFFPSHT